MCAVAILMTKLHLLPRTLYAVGVGTRDLILEGDAMVHGEMFVLSAKRLDLTVSSPTVTIDHGTRSDVLLDEGQ